MLILSQTTDKLQVVLGGAVTTNQLPCYCGWREITAETFVPDRNVVTTNGATDVDLVGSPAAQTQRVIDAVMITNLDTAIATVLVNLNANGTKYQVARAVLAPGERLEYAEGSGWRTFSVNGSIKAANIPDANAISSQMSAVVLASDVVNNNAVANTIQDVTGLSFSVLAGHTYWFRFVIKYSSGSTSTGSRWCINGPAASNIHLRQTVTLAATTQTNVNNSGYDAPTSCNASSLADGNIAVIEGFLTATESGTVIARFASETASVAITAKAGSVVFYQELV